MQISKKQIIYLSLFALVASVGSIAHGVFFDLKWEEIERLSVAGVLFTFVLYLPTFMFIEWVFDLNNRQEFKHLQDQISELQKKLAETK